MCERTLQLEQGSADLVTERWLALLVVDDMLAAKDSTTGGGGVGGAVGAAERHIDSCLSLKTEVMFDGWLVGWLSV